MKKITVWGLAVVTAVSLAACGNGKETKEETVAVQTTAEESTDEENAVEIKDDLPAEEQKPAEAAAGQPEALEKLQQAVEQDLSDTVTALNADYERLKTEIDSYDVYREKPEQVEQFYEHVNTVNWELCMRMREYSLACAGMILDSDKKFGEKYDDLEKLYDVIYDDAGEDIYDEIYDGVLDDIYDVFYDGILEKAYDTVPYGEWSEAREQEYDWWSDTRSEVYDTWSDCRSDIYDFWSDMRSKVYDKDQERAEKEMEDFAAKITKLQGNKQDDALSDDKTEAAASETVTEGSSDGTVAEEADPLETYGEGIVRKMEDAVSAMQAEAETFTQEISSYDIYMEHIDEVEAFYDKMKDDTEALCAELKAEGAVYTEMILESDLSAGVKYDTLDLVNDYVCEDAADVINDGIYEDLMKYMSESFYEGILEDAKDDAPYGEWLDAYSDEYSRWLDTGSDIYSEYLDTKSEIYGFWLEVKGEVFGKDFERAQKITEDFREKAST